MFKQVSLVVCLAIAPGVFAKESPKSMTDIMEYVQRTAKDYCSPTNQECINEFSMQMLSSFKDGQSDARSRFREQTLSDRYEKRLITTECIPSDSKYKDVCQSMVDRLVDSYNRGLNSK